MSNTNNCLILGGNSDIGKAIAEKFAANGFSITLAIRGAIASINTFSENLQATYGVPVTVVPFNGEDYGSHPAFYKGLKPVPDVVVSVFGYAGDNDIAIHNFDEAKRIIDANLTGHVSILNIAANQMQQAGRGTIIGISSVAGERGKQGNYIYAAAKAGFSTYVDGLRNRMFPNGVHVVTVKPGYVYTKMIADMPTPAVITAKPVHVANRVWQAYTRKLNTVYVYRIWWLIMMVIKLIPEPVFKRLKF